MSLPNSESPVSRSALPDYFPARMLNEFVYCPRLFYYEWVEGEFAHNRETVEGAIRHAKVDSGSGELAASEELAQRGETIHARSVTLASEQHRLIAKLDLVEADGETATPVDYKRGSPQTGDDGELQAWQPDRAQLAVQVLVLRENGYRCDEAIVYYVATKQRVRVAIDEQLVEQTLRWLAEARAVAESGKIPPPLEDSPKCPRCSLVGICLPDETRALRPRGRSGDEQLMLFEVDVRPVAGRIGNEEEEKTVRRLVPARDDVRPLYLNTQGLYVGKSGNVLKIKEKDKVIQEVRINDICQLGLFGNIQISTQAIQSLCESEVPIAYFSQGGWFYGITQGLGVKNIFLRREQFRLADVPSLGYESPRR